MEQDQSSTAAGSSPGGFNWENFESLSRQLRAAVERFQGEQTPENFAGIITALRGYGVSATEVWQTTADYTRRHPVRVAVFAGILFFALKGISDPGRPRQASLTYH